MSSTQVLLFIEVRIHKSGSSAPFCMILMMSYLRISRVCCLTPDLKPDNILIREFGVEEERSFDNCIERDQHSVVVADFARLAVYVRPEWHETT